MSAPVVLVTGGARGIGRTCADLFATRGASVAILDKDVSGCSSYAVTADIGHSDSLAGAIADVESTLGPIDVLVHAAAVSGPWRGLLDLDEATWENVIDVNVNGTFRVLKSVVPGMVSRGYGRVVLIASVAGKEGVPLLPAYSASKAAVIALTKSLAKDLASTGVLVNAVTPAGVDTGMTHETDPAIRERMQAAIPMGRFAQPEEVAEMVFWLGGPQCTFSTGAVFDVSGGRSTY